MKTRLLQGLLFAALCAAPVSAALFRVWVHHDAVQAGYELSSEESRRRELRRLEHQLEVELAAERSPKRLSQLAAELRLVPAAPHQITAASRPGRP